MNHRIGKQTSLLTATLFGFAVSVFGTPAMASANDAHHNAYHGWFSDINGPTAEHIAQQLEDTPLDYSQLHTYIELVDELYRIEANSHGSIDVGPLIKNGDNGGLIDIDANYSGIKTLRQAVVDTVANDAVPSLGNTDPAKVGKSNMGREIMAARFGNGPTRVVYITQQHGNEYIETEAALSFLRRLSHTYFPRIKNIAEEISLLMIVRANPDGGEPDPDRCQMGTPFPPPAEPNYDCAFYRFNIDPTAGTMPTDDPFRGAYGVGYNLNRYHVANLDKPVRPVENQAMVAAIKAFAPSFILDFHGDLPKVTCDIDPESITPVVPGLLYDSVCDGYKGSMVNNISVRDMAEFLGQSDLVAQRWNGLIANGMRLFGVQAGRHRQFNEATEILNTAGDYSQLMVEGEPVHTMLLEMRNSSPVADPFIAGMNFDQSPVTPKIDFALNQVLGERNYFIGKLLSEWIMFRGLNVIANGRLASVDGDGGYQRIPTDTGFVYEFSDLTMSVLGLENPGPYLFPLCTLQPCLTPSE